MTSVVNTNTAGVEGAKQTLTVASLPAASLNTSVMFVVSDANATTYASVVAGGGANKVSVYSDGTDWRIG